MNKSRIKIASIFVSVALVSTLAACSTAETGGGDGDVPTVLVGGVYPLSGEAASIGEASIAGAEIAAAEILKAGGPKIEFKWEDSQLDTQLGVTALESLIADGARAVLTGGSGVILAQVPTIDREGIPTLNTMAQSPLLADASPWLFNIIPTSTEELRQVAEIAVDDMGLKKIALLVVDNDLGKGDTTVLTEAVNEFGGKVVATEMFPVGASDMRTALTRIRDADPDALYIVGNTDELGKAIAQAGELGIDAQLLGRTQSLDPAVLAQAGDAINGMVGTATVFRPSDENTIAQGFIDAYEEREGAAPTVYGAVTYDSVKLIGAAFEDLGMDADAAALQKWFGSVSNFEGAMGVVEIGGDNTAVYPLFRFQVENGKVEPYKG